VLVDTNWQGQPRKLLLQANRNGFLYVIDRTDGKMLLGKPLMKKLTWASGIAANGRPTMNPNQTPTVEGNLICPAVEGAANFFSTSYSPLTGLFYVNTLERCNVYTKRTPRHGSRAEDTEPVAGAARPMKKPKKYCAPSTSGQAKPYGSCPRVGRAKAGAGPYPPRAVWSSLATTAVRYRQPTLPPGSFSEVIRSPKLCMHRR